VCGLIADATSANLHEIVIGILNKLTCLWEVAWFC
jgi:hypothetical protein